MAESIHKGVMLKSGPEPPGRVQWLVGRRSLISALAWVGVSARASAAPTADKGRTSLHQESDFPGDAQRIYEALLQPEAFAALSGEAADISPREGAAFTLFAGKIVGRNIELVPGARIVQAWRPAYWPPGVYSLVKFELRQHGTLTTVVLDQTGIPPGNFAHLDAGWRARYWEPLRKYLTE